MCLTSRQTKKELDAWLRKQSDEIIAYKVAHKQTKRLRSGPRKGKEVYYLDSVNFPGMKYKRKNRIVADRDPIAPSDYRSLVTHFQKTRPYKPFYHLWLKEPLQVGWEAGAGTEYLIIQCVVPKHLITAIGKDNYMNMECIITRGFDIRIIHHAYKKYFGEV